jgi:hypothetical protein
VYADIAGFGATVLLLGAPTEGDFAPLGAVSLVGSWLLDSSLFSGAFGGSVCGGSGRLTAVCRDAQPEKTKTPNAQSTKVAQ